MEHSYLCGLKSDPGCLDGPFMWASDLRTVRNSEYPIHGVEICQTGRIRVHRKASQLSLDQSNDFLPGDRGIIHFRKMHDGFTFFRSQKTKATTDVKENFCGCVYTNLVGRAGLNQVGRLYG